MVESELGFSLCLLHERGCAVCAGASVGGIGKSPVGTGGNSGQRNSFYSVSSCGTEFFSTRSANSCPGSFCPSHCFLWSLCH